MLVGTEWLHGPAKEAGLTGFYRQAGKWQGVRGLPVPSGKDAGKPLLQRASGPNPQLVPPLEQRAMGGWWGLRRGPSSDGADGVSPPRAAGRRVLQNESGRT